MAQPIKARKHNTFNPLEQAYEFVKDTAKMALTETFDALNPLSSLFHDEVSREREKGNNNFSEIDVQKLQKAYAENDSEEIQRLQRLIYPEQAKEQDEKNEEMEYHRRVQREEEEFLLKKEQEEEEEKRQEAIEEQQKQQEEANQAQPLESPKGKVRKNILGGGKPKANSELPPEFRPDAGKQ